MSDLSARIGKLSPTQLHQLHDRLRSIHGARAVSSPRGIVLRSRAQGPFPLSYAQRRIWLFEQLWPGTGTYNVPSAVRLQGKLRAPVLERALRAVVARHEILRTTIFLAGSEPVQQAVAEPRLRLPIIDLERLPAADRRLEAARWIRVEAALPFDIARGPFVRIWVIRHEVEDHVVLIDMHHLVCDNWSQAVFFHDLTAFYRAFLDGHPTGLPELPIQYIDYAAWQREWLSDERMEAQLAYWRRALTDAPPVLKLPLDRSRPAKMSFRGEIAVHRFARPALERLGEEEQVTRFMVLLAGFKIALHVFTGLVDVIVGSPVSGRERAGTENLIGFFANTLVLRTHLGGDPTLRELVRRERQVVLDAFAHQDVPFDKLIEDLKIQRDPSHPPLFQVNFVLEKSFDAPVEPTSLTMTHTEHLHKTAKFDINVFVSERLEMLQMLVLYNCDIFEEDTILRFMRTYERCLKALAETPESRLETVAAPLRHTLDQARGERQRRLKAGNLESLEKLRRRPAVLS